jgi:HEAT repeat protein
MNKSEIAISLIAIEPDLVSLARELTTEDLLKVGELTHDPDPRLRANAITLQSIIDEDAFIVSFKKALHDDARIVKLQALASVGNLSSKNATSLASITRQFLKDPDAGVRKLAIKASVRSADAFTVEELRIIARLDNETFVRELANDVVSRLR